LAPKLCLFVISAPISHFINAPLACASFRLPLKTAAVTPVLKKSNIDLISNLPFLAKLL